jgi:hypothetical protein
MTIGSSQTGGSSGGPWLVNFGTNPVFGTGSAAPNSDLPNLVVGTTSWATTTAGSMQMGASQFANNTAYPYPGPSNIDALLTSICKKSPTSC